MTKKKDNPLRVQQVREKIEELLSAERMTGAELMRRGGFSPAGLYLNLSKMRDDKALIQERKGREVILGMRDVDYGDDNKALPAKNGKSSVYADFVKSIPAKAGERPHGKHPAFGAPYGQTAAQPEFIHADHVVHAIRTAYGAAKGTQIIKAIAEHLQGAEQTALLLAWLKVA